MASPTNAALPPRPRLTFRLGFAGRKELSPSEEENLRQRLPEVFDTIGVVLAAIATKSPTPAKTEPPVAQYFSDARPLIRLITGLCEGADAIAADVFSRPPSAIQSKEPNASLPGVERETAAVIPFDVQTYRQSRPDHFHADLDRQLAKAAWILSLDGVFERPDPDTPKASIRRTRAYRAQSTFLLRHSDLLIAAANTDELGKPGGTLETVREALAFEIPVIFLHTATGEVFLIDPQGDWSSSLAEKPPSVEERTTVIQKWVRQIAIDPDHLYSPQEHDSRKAHRHGEDFLREFFDAPQSPSQEAKKQTIRLRKAIWTWFERRFQSTEGPQVDQAQNPFVAYRARASTLSSHYGSLYRGAFLLNYLLAILAVLLATVGLTLLGSASHTATADQVSTIVQTAGEPNPTSNPNSKPSAWLLPPLVALAAMKFVMVACIALNTWQANRNGWNERAVDYRYLSERLRAMLYLPLAGSCQPPAAAPPQFASRVVRQSRVDWLFDAIVRSVSPAEFPDAKAAEFASATQPAPITIQKLLTVRPKQAIEAVRDRWIAQQAKYHARNSKTMHGLHRFTLRYASRFAWTVFVIVAIDLSIVIAEYFHAIPPNWAPWARLATPWLVFASAILPALVAALNGIRFQSECQRLAERSSVMSVMLRGRTQRSAGDTGGRIEAADRLLRRIHDAEASPTTNPGAWCQDALRFTENVATDFIQEAAEWSVLYTKEVSDPG